MGTSGLFMIDCSYLIIILRRPWLLGQSFPAVVSKVGKSVELSSTFCRLTLSTHTKAGPYSVLSVEPRLHNSSWWLSFWTSYASTSVIHWQLVTNGTCPYRGHIRIHPYGKIQCFATRPHADSKLHCRSAFRRRAFTDLELDAVDSWEQWILMDANGRSIRINHP